MRTVLVRVVGSLALLALVAGTAACSSDDDASADIVVTTNVLGDVVRTIVGDDASVHVVMPPAANPHDFSASAQEAARRREAAVIVVNGRGFEEGLLDTVEAAEADGAVVVEATDGLPETDEHGQEGGEIDADHGHEHDGDAHFFSDPVLMAAAVDHLAAELRAHVPALDTDAFAERVDAYLEELEALFMEATQLLTVVPPGRRVLVTNHEVLGFFADRFGFEVLGVIIPGGSTLAEPSAADLADLAATIEAAGVPAIFAETSSPSRLADALAAEGTDVEVVELFTESLGEAGSGADTYLGMVRTNAQRIADALAG
ncbi:MAG: metal ABC transporter solute-binding protein, Zn/Mn family [Actinomycetota bacterium]